MKIWSVDSNIHVRWPSALGWGPWILFFGGHGSYFFGRWSYVKKIWRGGWYDKHCFYICCTLTNRKTFWNHKPHGSVKNMIKHSICSIIFADFEACCNVLDFVLQCFASFVWVALDWQCCRTPHRLLICSRCHVMRGNRENSYKTQAWWPCRLFSFLVFQTAPRCTQVWHNLMKCQMASPLAFCLGVLKCCEKVNIIQDTSFLVLFSWKALALPKQSLKVPESMKKLKNMVHEGPVFGNFLVGSKLELKEDICQPQSLFHTTQEQ